ncbi:MAG TPA: hypothetical protein VMK83_10640 [Gaiellaceae bacterium]|nr:hypothetical protein [Gaiellaceae bacterium]
MRGRRLRLAGVALVVAVLGTAGEARTAEPPKLLCTPPPGSELLPPTARHGLIDHLLQYPAVHLATRAERARARQVLDQLVAVASRQRWRSLAAAERAGYDTRTAPGRPGDRSVRFFHAERGQEPRRGPLLDPTRPKALIYANAPGRPLVLVGAMWSTRDGELGPTPAGPILRWHSHIVCKRPGQRGLKPPPGGECPLGAQLRQGTSEMLHVWFTRDLRSAFAISAPRPELCASGLIPGYACR